MELLRPYVMAQGKAAELLQLTRWAFSECSEQSTVPAIDRTSEELQDTLTIGRTRRSPV
jgi:hypothetical protein